MKNRGGNIQSAGSISLLFPVVLFLTTQWALWAPTVLCQTPEMEDTGGAVTLEMNENCQPVLDQSCKKLLPYNYTYDSLDLTAVIEEIGFSTNCSEDLTFLICAWKQPQCQQEPEIANLVVGPCRDLCERTVDLCGSSLEELVNSAEWSHGMGCSELPVEKTDQEGLCVIVYNETEIQKTNVPTPLLLPTDEIYDEEMYTASNTTTEQVSTVNRVVSSSKFEGSPSISDINVQGQGVTLTTTAQTDITKGTTMAEFQPTAGSISTTNVEEEVDDTLSLTTREASTETSLPNFLSRNPTAVFSSWGGPTESESTTKEGSTKNTSLDLSPTETTSLQADSETKEPSRTVAESTIVTSVLPISEQAATTAGTASEARTTFIPPPPSPPPPSPFFSSLYPRTEGVTTEWVPSTGPAIGETTTRSILNESTSNLNITTEPVALSTTEHLERFTYGETTSAHLPSKEITESRAGTVGGTFTWGSTLFNATSMVATLFETTENSYVYSTWRMTMNGDCDYAEEHIESFSQSFVKTLAAMLYLRQAQVKIGMIKCGSVIVEFTLEFQSGKDDEQMEKAENELIRISVTKIFIIEVDGRIYVVNDVILLSHQPPVVVDPTGNPTEPQPGGMSFEEQQFIIYLVLGCVLAVILFVAILICVQKYCKTCCVKKASAPEFPDEHCGVRLADFNMTNRMIPRPKSIYADTLTKNGKLKPYMTEEEIEQAIVPYFYANEALVHDLPDTNLDGSLMSTESGGLFQNSNGIAEWHSNYTDTLTTNQVNSILEETPATLDIDDSPPPPPPPSEPPPLPPYPLPDELSLHTDRETRTSTPSTADTNWLLSGVQYGPGSHTSDIGLDNAKFVMDTDSQSIR